MMHRLLPLLLTAGLAACSTFDDHELARFRDQRVAPPVYTKLSRGEAVEPGDVIELKRRGVADSLIIRQIEDHGVASIIGRADVLAMRKAGASAAVIDAMLRASDEFAGDYAAPDYSTSITTYDPGYYEPWPVHGTIGIGFSTGRYYHGGHYRGHRHR